MSRIIPLRPRPEPPIEIQPRSPRYASDALYMFIWLIVGVSVTGTIAGWADILARIFEWGPYR